jgi:hypothetical protein
VGAVLAAAVAGDADGQPAAACRAWAAPAAAGAARTPIAPTPASLA